MTLDGRDGTERALFKLLGNLMSSNYRRNRIPLHMQLAQCQHIMLQSDGIDKSITEVCSIYC